MTTPWLLYGANGYTGELVAKEAVRRGHKPILAGRSEEKLRPLADQLGLPFRVFSLDDRARTQRGLEGVGLVFHAAGPFVHTSAQMIDACLQKRAHYVDVTGEVPVFEHTFSRQREALANKVCLMSGVGFDVVPSDCLAKHVADAVPGATHLELVIAGGGRASAGTTKSVLEMLPQGNLARRDGALVHIPHGTPTQELVLGKPVFAVGVPWGDLVTAHHSTGIPNITTYMTFPRAMARALRLAGGALGWALKQDALRHRAAAWVSSHVEGPNADERDRGRSMIYARAWNNDGGSKESVLETPEGYKLTAMVGVRCVERILSDNPHGALSPSQAFGADFILELPGVTRSPYSGKEAA